MHTDKQMDIEIEVALDLASDEQIEAVVSADPPQRVYPTMIPPLCRR